MDKENGTEEDCTINVPRVRPYRVNKHGLVSANQSVVIGLTGRPNWTRATELYLLSNQNASLY